MHDKEEKKRIANIRKVLEKELNGEKFICHVVFHHKTDNNQVSSGYYAIYNVDFQNDPHGLVSHLLTATQFNLNKFLAQFRGIAEQPKSQPEGYR